LLVFKNVLELEHVDLSGHACAAVINEDAGTLDFDLSKKEYTSLSALRAFFKDNGNTGCHPCTL